MTSTGVGIREFRANLADYIKSDTPTTVTRHGHTVGYFIPTHGDRQAAVAKFQASAAKVHAFIEAQGVDAEDLIKDFEDSRRDTRR